MTDDVWLAALLDQYATTERLRHRSVPPEPLATTPSVDRDAFAVAYRSGTGETSTVAFRSMQERARDAMQLPSAPDADADCAFERYVEWHAFQARRAVILSRVATNLGYDAEIAT